jgi:phospholipid/cholesterol/gamma-HCH transport system ATP-binding protein
MSAVLQVRGLFKSFGKLKVLNGVDIDFEEGKISAIVGQSGTGKSVLFKSMIGLMKPDAGTVRYRDLELTTMEGEKLFALRKHIGYAFQNAALFDSMSVAENIEFPLREVLGIRKKPELRRRVAEMLDWIDLPGIEDMRTDELSGGMRKRVGVARVLVMKPDVLLFDEPTTGLDPVLAETINNLVIRVNRELGLTCLLITHDIPAAFRIADRIAFLDQGKIVAEGEPSMVAASEHELVRNFIRTSFGELKL